MRRKKNLVLLVFLAFILMVLLIFRPVNIRERADSLVQTGTVQDIFEGGDKDIVFKLYETTTLFYINRGLEQGFTIEGLKHRLLDKDVTIRYPDHWTPFDPGRSSMHLSELEYNNEILFSEYDE